MIQTGVVWQGHAIAAAAGAKYDPALCQVVANVSETVLLGGAIYEEFTGKSVKMHTAGFVPRWVTRDLLWCCFHYPFEQLGVTKVIGIVNSSNLKALAFDRHLGFKEEAVISDVYPDGNAIVMGMYRQDCRWLSIKTSLTRGHDGQE